MQRTIAVNTRLLLKGKMEGMGWFAYETLKRVVQQHPNDRFIFLFDRPYDTSFVLGANVVPIVAPPPARHPILYFIWLEWSVPRILKKHQVDLFLSPDGFLSLRTKVPQVPVIHDLGFEHFPKDVPWLTRSYYRFFFPRWAAKAKRIATVSNFSKADIANRYQVDESKIDVVYNGVKEEMKPVSERVKANTRDTFTAGKPYFVFVGAIHNRKNIVNTLLAFDLFKQQTGAPMQLLFVGNKMWWTSEMEETLNKSAYKSDVVFIGRKPADVLHHVIASALALVYVSRFEGFGIPIIEAFACGVPVITSDITSMPEVAGDAAILVNPYDINNIASAMVQIAESAALRRALEQKGLARAALFTWQNSANALWEVIQKALSETSG